MAKSNLVINDTVSVAIFKSMLNSLDDCIALDLIKCCKEDFLHHFFSGYNVCKANILIVDSTIEWIKYETIDYIEPDSEIYDFIENSIRRTFLYAIKKFSFINNPLSFLELSDDNVITLSIESKTVDYNDYLDRTTIEYLNTTTGGSFVTVAFREHKLILDALDYEVKEPLDRDLIITDLMEIIEDENVQKTEISEKVHAMNTSKYFLNQESELNCSSNEKPEELGQNFTLPDNSTKELLNLLAVKIKESLLANNMYQNGVLDYKPLPLHQNGVCFFKKV